ncbi:MAG: hypothetical protein ACFWT0_04680 [Bifidobacterium crudilactis]|uniref:hypothetical protein n=1 Tax=Bifidobacterium crudilactis TaxID=327277 RepID=UPI0023545178|nr:hypothetical protein [Bifidobacterium crudilactis]
MNTALPTLTGTTKQIAYANDLRDERIADIIETTNRFIDEHYDNRLRDIALHIWQTETSAKKLINLATAGLPLTIKLSAREQFDSDVAAFETQWESEHPAEVTEHTPIKQLMSRWKMTPEQKAQREANMQAEHEQQMAKDRAKHQFLADRYQQSLNK